MKEILTNFARTEKFYVLLIAAVAFAVMMPVLFKGLPFGYDLPHHYQCAMTFYESVLNGDFYPSWSANRNFGFGGMEARLYPPVSHYSLAVAYLMTGDWHIASWLIFVFYTFIGGLGVYLWAKEYMPASQAVLAGCLFNLLPYHLNQLYNTFFYAEFVGTALMPLVFVFVARVCKRGRMADVLGLSISFAALVLTHLPLTVIGSLCFTIYALSLLDREKVISQISKLAAGVIAGLAASSFFWTKVLLEKDLMAKTLIYADPWIDFRYHFLLTVFQKFEGSTQTGVYENATYFYDLMFFYAVLVALACAIPFYIWEKRRAARLSSVWLVFGVAAFMAIPLSRPIWEALKPIQEVQFPWRFLAIISITAPVIAASQTNLLIEWFRNKKRPLALVIVGCVVAAVTFSVSQIIRQAPFIPKDEVTAFMQKNQTDIGFTFWWTIWTRKEAFENKEQVTVEDGNVEILKWTATEREFLIAAGKSNPARVATFYHPNWKATINNVPTVVERDAAGAIKIPLPAAQSSVKLSFDEPFAVKIGQWISALFWLGFILLAVFGALKRQSIAARIPNSADGRKNSYALRYIKLLEIAESRYRFLLLAAFCLLTVLPTIFIGVYQGVDLPQHVQFSSTFYESIRSGDFYPSWAAQENFGYGSLGARFYPPLTPFLFAVARILTGNWHSATYLVFFLYTFAGAVAVYLWAKEFFDSNAQCILAAMIFTVMPYHLYQIQNGSQFAEFAGCAVIPFAMLFTTRITKRGSLSDVLGLAVSFAVLVLTHLPTTVIGSLALFLYALVSLPKEKRLLKLLKLSAAVLAALAASSVYWLKLVTEMSWLRITKFSSDHFYDYSYNFLLTADWFGEKQLWFINYIFLTLVFVCVAAAFALYFYEAAKKFRAVIAVLFFSLLMCVALSKPVWMTVPFLPEVQFPWRWLTIVSSSGAIVLAALPSLSRLSRNSKVSPNLLKSCAFLALLALLGIYTLMWFGFRLNNVPAHDYENFVAEKTQSLGGEWFWTTGTKEEIFSIREKVIADNRQIDISAWRATDRAFSVSAGNQTEARVATLFYPNWQATVNGEPVQLKTADDGAILIPLPPESADVRLTFEESSRIRFGIYLSLGTWFLFLASFILLRLKKVLAFGSTSPRN